MIQQLAQKAFLVRSSYFHHERQKKAIPAESAGLLLLNRGGINGVQTKLIGPRGFAFGGLLFCPVVRAPVFVALLSLPNDYSVREAR